MIALSEAGRERSLTVFLPLLAVNIILNGGKAFAATFKTKTMLVIPDPEADAIIPLYPVLFKKRGKTMALPPMQDILNTAQQIIAHWQQVNIALGNTAATDLKLSGNYLVANLTADRTALQTQMDVVATALNAQTTVAGTRDVLRSNIRTRLTDFRVAVRYNLKGSGYVNSLPTLPAKTASENRTIQTYVDMLTLWTAINADATVPGFTPPLIIPGAVALAAYTTEVTNLRNAYNTLATNAAKLRIERDKRDVLAVPLYNRLIEYRVAVPGKMGAAHPLSTSLPPVSPTGGATPKPVVNPFVVWDTAAAKAHITWEASPSPNINGYDVRFCIASPYRVEDENPLVSVAADVFSVLTNQNLPASGSTIYLRIYAKNSTGNEKGSKTLKITRP